MKSPSILALAATIITAAGCAHLPDATLQYQLPETTVAFKVTRSASCDKAKRLFVGTAVTPIVTHAGNPSDVHTIRLSSLRGPFTDTEFKLELHDDGRIRAINTTNTGQGETILKAFVSAVAAFGLKSTDELKGLSQPDACDFVNGANNGKPITLTYEGKVDLSRENAGVTQELPYDPGSVDYVAGLSDVIGNVCVVFENPVPPTAPATHVQREGDVLVTLRQPAAVLFSVKACNSKIDGRPLWMGRIPVSQWGTNYGLPIPAAAVFGKQVFGVSIAESGALQSVTYNRSAGAGQAANVLTSAEGADTAAYQNRAAEARAEADMLAQQQRLAACRARPTDCK